MNEFTLFTSSTIWYPGLNLKKTVEVKNTGNSVISLGIKVTNVFQSGKLSEALIFKVDEGGHYVFGENGDKTINDFLNLDKGFKIVDLNPNETKTIGITVSLPKTIGNEYQNKELKLYITVEFTGSTEIETKVLGTTSLIKPTTIADIGKVKGTTTKNFSKYIFALILLVISLLIVFYYYKKRKSGR